MCKFFSAIIVPNNILYNLLDDSTVKVFGNSSAELNDNSSAKLFK